jgi:hypothetical protein
MLERVWLFLQLALLITTATVLISTDSKPTSLENKLVLIGYISEQATNKNDKVIFWTMRPEIYSYANRLPGTRFLTPGFVFNYSSIVDTHYVATKYGIKNGEKILLEDIRSSKPKIIVDYCNSKDNEICSLQLIPGVREILKNYRVIAIVEDAIIYERNT